MMNRSFDQLLLWIGCSLKQNISFSLNADCSQTSKILWFVTWQSSIPCAALALHLKLKLHGSGKGWDLSPHVSWHEKHRFQWLDKSVPGYLSYTMGEFWHFSSFVLLPASEAHGKTSANAVICHLFQTTALWPTSLPVPRHQEMRQDIF